jgi:hypothetical protein
MIPNMRLTSYIETRLDRREEIGFLNIGPGVQSGSGNVYLEAVI